MSQSHSGSGDNVYRDKHVHYHGEDKKDFPKYLTSAFPRASMENFVGRERDLDKLHELLQNEKPLLLLNGLGGIGKTTLAMVYCDRYAKHYDRLAWITQTDTFENAWLQATHLQQLLGITPGQDPQATIRAMLTALRTVPGERKLLVLDNAERSLQAYTDYLPPNWKILITSRQELDSRYTTYPLGTLPPDEARTLFRKHYRKSTCTDAELDELLQDIGHHTLTLELLAKTLQESFELQTVAELHEYVRTHRWDDTLLQEAVFTDHSRKEVELLSYLLNAFKLAKLTEEEQWLLLQLAVLPPLPHEAKDLLDWLQAEGDTRHTYARHLKSLARRGWLERKDGALLIHRMVQTVVRYQKPPSYEHCTALVDTFSELMKIDTTKDNPVDKFQWLEYGVSLCEYLSVDDKAIAELNDRLGYIYEFMGAYQDAARHKKVALDYAEQIEDAESVARYQSNLASVYRNLGKFKEAANLFEKSLQFAIEQLGEEHHHVAIYRSNLANVYRDLGRYKQAADLLEKAIEAAIIHFSENHPLVATYRSNLANVYGDLGRYEQAADLLEKALQADVQHFGENHPTVATRRSNLAIVYRYLGRYEEAADLLEKVIEFEVPHFGESHPKVATRRSNLALVYQDLGRYDEAADLLEKALQADVQHFGENHPTVATIRSNLANVYRNLGSHEEAVDLLEKALQADLQHFGENHPTVATRLNNLAHVYLATHQLQEAKDLFAQAYHIRLDAFGESHPHTQDTKRSLDYTIQRLEEE